MNAQAGQGLPVLTPDGSRPDLADLEAEQALLGAVLVGDPEITARFAQEYESSLFAHGGTQALGDVLADRVRRGLSIFLWADGPELVEALANRGCPIKLGDLTAFEAPTAWQYPGLFTRLKGLQRRRALEDTGRRLIGLAHDLDRDPETVLQDLRENLEGRQPATAITPISAKDLLAADLPARQDVIGGGVVPQGGLCLLAGAPKTGKTIFAQQMAVAVAQGAVFLDDFQTTPGRVLYLSGEGGPKLLRERLRVMAPEAARENLLCWWPEGAETLKLDDAAGRARLIDCCKREDISLVIVDPLVRFHRLDENSTGDMTQLTEHIHEVRRLTGAAILLVHHTRKAGVNSQAGSAGEARGSSVIHGDIDSGLVLTARRPSEDHTLHFELRWSPEPPALRLELESDSLTFRVLGILEGGKRKLSPEKVKELLAQIGASTTAELAAASGVTERTVKTYIGQLGEAGEVFAVSEGRGRKRWHLPSQKASLI